MDFGWWGGRDIAAAVSFLGWQPGIRTGNHRSRGCLQRAGRGRWFHAASPATVQVWVVPHAGHTQGLATAPLAWETHVISFLTAALHPVTSPAGQSAGSNG
jgi:hypothetical protein